MVHATIAELKSSVVINYLSQHVGETKRRRLFACERLKNPKQELSIICDFGHFNRDVQEHS